MNIFTAKDECGCVVAATRDRHDAGEDVADWMRDGLDVEYIEAESVTVGHTCGRMTESEV